VPKCVQLWENNRNIKYYNNISNAAKNMRCQRRLLLLRLCNYLSVMGCDVATLCYSGVSIPNFFILRHSVVLWTPN
jgi:hypothetical protein